LEVMSGQLMYIGREAPTFKLIGNSMILGCMEVLAEAQTLAEKSGIGAEAVQNLVRGKSAPILPVCRVIHLYRRC
jgi:3-hydroxyisobutyrate dehydrogenase-like beta-hydroxyacid dehydrogenase